MCVGPYSYPLDGQSQRGGGLFATHPHIEERLDKASDTVTAPFLEDDVFQGLTDCVFRTILNTDSDPS